MSWSDLVAQTQKFVNNLRVEKKSHTPVWGLFGVQATDATSLIQEYRSGSSREKSQGGAKRPGLKCLGLFFFRDPLLA